MRIVRDKANGSNTVSVVCFLFGLTLLSVTTLSAIFSTERVSVSENRVLAAKPLPTLASVRSGSYFLEWEQFIADHIPYRTAFLRLSGRLKTMYGVEREVQMVTIPADIGVFQANSPDASTPAQTMPAQTMPAQTTPAIKDADFPKEGNAPAIPEEKAEIQQDVLILPDRLLEIYHYNEDLCNQYVSTLNQAASILPETIRIYSMVIPLRITFEDAAYSTLSDSQEQAFALIAAHLSERIQFVDVYSQFEKHKGEYLYFRSDHHWTALGAYYGLATFAKEAGIDILDLDQYEAVSKDGFLGYLYQMLPDSAVKDHPDTLTYYIQGQKNNPTVVYSYDSDHVLQTYTGTMLHLPMFEESSYGVFLGGDQPLIQIDGDSGNGRVLALVKDSYGNAFAPWLTPYFSKILVIDPRYFQQDFYKLLEDRGVTDLLVLNTMKVTMLEQYLGILERLLNPAK
ncbi:MAG: DHHW family protein [Clostridiales bacterium]|nr:DHHW family protein [Clostridiales bacterium]